MICNYCKQYLLKSNYSTVLHYCDTCNIEYWIKKNRIYRLNIFINETLCLCIYSTGKTYIKNIECGKHIVTLPFYFIKNKSIENIRKRIKSYMPFI